MKLKLFLVGLLLHSSLAYYSASLPAYASSCSPGSSSSNEYIQRDNNRCEGIARRDRPITGDISLSSLTISNGETLDSTLVIQIPNMSSRQPNVAITEPSINYLLDSLLLESLGSFYRFELPTNFLYERGVHSLNPLRGLAKTGGGQGVYLPIIFGAPASEYRFVFSNTRPTIFKKAEIRRSNRETLTGWGVQRRIPQGEKEFRWAPGSTVAGLYIFYFEAEIEQSTGQVESIARSYTFEHDPNWLR